MIERARLRGVVSGGVVLLALLGLSGCGNPVDLFTGGDPIASYCSKLSADQPAFAQMIGDGSPTALMNQLPMLEGLAAASPSDVSDDWQAFLRPIRALRAALAAAGLKPGDYHDAHPPAGLSASRRQAITDAADQLSADSTVQAAGAVEQEARDVCKINLGM